jgi:hypothetical protein
VRLELLERLSLRRRGRLQVEREEIYSLLRVLQPELLGCYLNRAQSDSLKEIFGVVLNGSQRVYRILSEDKRLRRVRNFRLEMLSLII